MEITIMSMNALNKKDDSEDDTTYLMKMMKSILILERGEDIEMIIQRIGIYL